MRRERFDPIAEPAPRMSDGALAEVEALRASDRLQRIFESDVAPTRRAGPVPTAPPGALRQDGAAAPPGAGASAGRGFFASRRARVLVGLFPVYLAMAVMAVEGVRTLRSEPDRAAFVSATGPAGGAPRAALGAEAVTGRQDPAGTEAPAGEMLASLPAPERSSLPKSRPAPSSAEGLAGLGGKASDDRAKGMERAKGLGDVAGAERAADRIPARPGRPGEAGAVRPETSPTAPAAPPGRAGTTTAAAGVAEPARRAEGGDDSGGAGVGVLASAEPGARRAAGRAEPAARGQAKDIAGRRIAALGGADASLARPGRAEPAEPAPGVARAVRPGAAAPEPLDRGASAGEPRPADPSADGGETVPQATWSTREAASVPMPAPRFARLTDVLAGARAGRAQAAETAPGATPGLAGGADTAAPTRPHAPPAPARQAGSAPPRIVLHYPRDAGPDAARRVAAELLARGYARTELRPVSFAISQANVRFFHDQNRPVARTVNALVEANGRRSDLRDFTDYSPLPSVGTIEVWLPG